MKAEKYGLIGINGNAFCVMGYVLNAMKECGKKKSEMDEYKKRAMSSDYTNLLSESLDMVEKLNNIQIK